MKTAFTFGATAAPAAPAVSYRAPPCLTGSPPPGHEAHPERYCNVIRTFVLRRLLPKASESLAVSPPTSPFALDVDAMLDPVCLDGAACTSPLPPTMPPPSQDCYEQELRLPFLVDETRPSAVPERLPADADTLDELSPLAYPFLPVMLPEMLSTVGAMAETDYATRPPPPGKCPSASLAERTSAAWMLLQAREFGVLYEVNADMLPLVDVRVGERGFYERVHLRWRAAVEQLRVAVHALHVEL